MKSNTANRAVIFHNTLMYQELQLMQNDCIEEDIWLPIHDCPSTTRIKFISSDSQRTQLCEMMRTPRPSYNPVKYSSLTNLDSPLPFSQRLTAEMASKQLHVTFLHKFLSSFVFHHMFLQTRAAPKYFAWKTKCSHWQLWSRHSLRMNTKRCNNGKNTTYSYKFKTSF